MKTLIDVQNEMGLLYQKYKAKEIERADAAEMANIAGKWLKAEQLKIANRSLDLQLAHAASVVTPLLGDSREAVEGDFLPN